ncbi:hypothetical protein WN51_03935 [Melipona quadrifasciata]|uniref:Uncharacterized protein n=1 Tax=Melipona quadrifasciata TaxID=166423 RepID=A0A0M8ZS68_9HYME|nr:hypothetical protein WN51_03935 [Melipona quadrifasciata]
MDATLQMLSRGNSICTLAEYSVEKERHTLYLYTAVSHKWIKIRTSNYPWPEIQTSKSILLPVPRKLDVREESTLLARLEIYHGPESDSVSQATVSLHSFTSVKFPFLVFIEPERHQFFFDSPRGVRPNLKKHPREARSSVATPTVLSKSRRNAKAARIFHTAVSPTVLRIFLSTALDTIDFPLFQRDLEAATP